MRNVLDEIDISQIKGVINQPILPIWVYGTLRSGMRFNYFLEGCSANVGECQMKGTLMQMENGDVFLRKDVMRGDLEKMAVGELYRVSIAGLWRIFHLENQSGSFPKAYDLSVSEVFEMGADKSIGVALWFRRKEEEPMPHQDISKCKSLPKELVSFLKEILLAKTNIAQDDIDGFLRNWMKGQARVVSDKTSA